MGRPRGSGNEVAVGNSLVHRDIGIGGASQLDLGRAGRVAGDGLAAYDLGGGQQLGAVAHRRDRLSGSGKLLDDGDHARIEAQVLGRAAAGNCQRMVVGGIDLVETGVQRKQVARLFGIGLVAFEIVDGGFDGVAGALARADGMDDMTDHLQRLEWHHGLVILGKVAGQKQDVFGCHDRSFRGKEKGPRRCRRGPRYYRVLLRSLSR